MNVYPGNKWGTHRGGRAEGPTSWCLDVDWACVVWAADRDLGLWFHHFLLSCLYISMLLCVRLTEVLHKVSHLSVHHSSMKLREERLTLLIMELQQRTSCCHSHPHRAHPLYQLIQLWLTLSLELMELQSHRLASLTDLLMLSGCLHITAALNVSLMRKYKCSCCLVEIFKQSGPQSVWEQLIVPVQTTRLTVSCYVQLHTFSRLGNGGFGCCMGCTLYASHDALIVSSSLPTFLYTSLHLSLSYYY